MIDNNMMGTRMNTQDRNAVSRLPVDPPGDRRSDCFLCGKELGVDDDGPLCRFCHTITQ
jgi:hypothetical protein